MADRLRRAYNMRHYQKCDSDNNRDQGSVIEQEAKSNRRGGYRPDPPDLPRAKIRRRHGGKLGRQPQPRRKCEHDKSRQPPEHALAPAT